MPTPQQTANLTYKTSLNLVELKNAFEQFKRVCANYARFNISEEVDAELFHEKRDSQALLIRLGAKYLVLYYLQGYRHDRYDMLQSFLKAGIEQADKGGFAKTGDLCKRLQTYIKNIHEVVTLTVTLIGRIRDTDGRLSTPSPEVLEETRKTLQKTASDLEINMTDVCPFPEDVQMPNIKAELLQNFYEEIEWIGQQVGAARIANAERFVKENTTPISEFTGLPKAVLAPSPIGMNTSSNVTVLSTPFLYEAIFSVRSYAENVNKTFRIVSANLFIKGSEAECGEVFALLKAPGVHLLITDINLVKEESAPYIYKQILRFASPDNLVFLVDTVGDRKVYDDLSHLVDSVRGTDALTVSYTFLKMPPLEDVLSVFETHRLFGAITEELREEIRRTLPFMGYVGLSGCVEEYNKGYDPLLYGEGLSESNRRTASRYLSRLSASYQFIDGSWGDFSEGISTASGTKKPFDYSVIRLVDPENIRLLLQKHDLTLFEKCGIATKYCTLCGDSETAWSALEVKEKQARMQEASSVLCSILNTQYIPEVEVLDEDEWKERGYHKKSGGLCCDGGKKIIYRHSSVENYDYALHVILHECFHAFQHTTVDQPFAEWYFDELGVTRGRISKWAMNFSCYHEISITSKAYKVEIVECDANAFSDDCQVYAKTSYHDFTFE